MGAKTDITSNISSKTKRKGSIKFDWTIQLCDFDRDESNVFFPWVLGDNNSIQGTQFMSQIL